MYYFLFAVGAMEKDYWDGNQQLWMVQPTCTSACVMWIKVSYIIRVLMKEIIPLVEN